MVSRTVLQDCRTSYHRGDVVYISHLTSYLSVFCYHKQYKRVRKKQLAVTVSCCIVIRIDDISTGALNRRFVGVALKRRYTKSIKSKRRVKDTANTILCIIVTAVLNRDVYIYLQRER